MPWKLRKAPKRDLYWVVNKETGRKYSKEPIPRDRAEAQMRLLYMKKRKSGAGTLEGEGFLDDAYSLFKKGVSAVSTRVSDVMKGKRQDYPPPVRAYLAKYGDRPISGLTLRRDPLKNMLNAAINAFTLGKWADVRKKFHYDKVFHLALEATLDGGPTTVIEKNQVINVGPSYPKDANTETLIMNDPGTLTINQMLAKTQRLMGDRYFNYSAFDNNCQDYILAILRANNLWTPDRERFIKQPMEEVIKELPSYTGRLANVATDLAAVANVAIQGRGTASKLLHALRGGQLSPEEFARLRAQRMASVGKPSAVRCPPDKKYDPEKEYRYGDNVCVDKPDGTIAYIEIQDPEDPVEPCYVGHPRGPKKFMGNKKRSECVSINEEGLKRWEASRSPTDKFFSGVLQGLTTVADTAVDVVGQVPGIGKAAAEAYKQFAPPGSSFYQPDKATEEKIADAARGIVGLGKGQKVVMSLAQFKKEHQNLIRLLRKYRKPDLLAEAADQAEELKKYTGGCCGNHMERNEFLRLARIKARKAGLNWQSLELSSKPEKKLMIKTPDGRVVHFGAKGMMDFIHYQMKKDPQANERRRLYRARATKIKGDWKSDPYSPNSLAINILW
jgi:hypothetical protein